MDCLGKGHLLFSLSNFMWLNSLITKVKLIIAGAIP